MFVLHQQGDGLHKDGILGPRLQVLKAHIRVGVFVLQEIHVHRVPAVGAAAVLAVKLCDVLERAAEDTKPYQNLDPPTLKDFTKSFDNQLILMDYAPT